MPPEQAPAPVPAPTPKSPVIPLTIALVVLIVAGAGLWFVLTRDTGEAPGGLFATSTPQGSTEAEKLHVVDNGDYYEIDVAYPSSAGLKATAGASADATAVALMKTFAEQEAARFRDNADEFTVEDRQLVGQDRKYVLDADYDVHVSPVTISYVYHMYADTLGAHPNLYYRTFTFDKETGEGLLIDDLFGTSDYLDVLSNESRKRLRTQIAEASQLSEDELATDMIDAGTTPNVDNFGNFYLEGIDLVLVFPPYQVGPWVIGTQEVRLPRASLGNTLKAKYR